MNMCTENNVIVTQISLQHVLHVSVQAAVLEEVSSIKSIHAPKQINLSSTLLAIDRYYECSRVELALSDMNPWLKLSVN